MSQQLISKKELLARYEISYGALYRWKRKGLIPEEWFIKKATVTGQETFFPKELICQRVEMIITQKTEVSLEELARKLFFQPHNHFLTIDTVYGKKTFSIDDIHSILVENQDGSIRDITDIIKGETL